MRHFRCVSGPLKAGAVLSYCQRSLSGVAPVLFFPETKPRLPYEEQVAVNTKVATEVLRKFKGTPPEPYKRRHNATIEQIENEINTLLGSAQEMRKSVRDDQSMDKVTLIERCLRHGLWSYKKDEGAHNFDEYSKWLVYTIADETRMNQLRRSVENSEKYAQFKKRRAGSEGDKVSLPKVDWEEEYKAAIDREVLVERRLRYSALRVNTRDKDDKALEEVNREYRKPTQDKRLDDLVDLLERFKPVLAREAILQRLTVKHLEGQLAVWRYLDWCPEVRDRSELEVDFHGLQWWMQWEEKRLLNIRLRSKNEVINVMEKNQAEYMASRPQSQQSAVSRGSSDEVRDKLLKEVLALQARISHHEDSEEGATDGPAAAAKKAGGSH